jgi:hypothetical protein
MKTTIELCKTVGFPLMVFEGVPYVSPELERLVALVRADERAVSVQEPVAWYDSESGVTDFHSFKPVRKPNSPTAEWLPLYTTPPAAQRTWVGLTDEERMDILLNLNWDKKLSHMDTALAIEAKLKEKNT